MTNKAKLSTVWMLACACSSHATSPVKAPEAAISRPAEVVTGGGETDLRPRAVVTSALRNATAVPQDLRITATISCRQGGRCQTEAAETRSLVAARIRLIGSDGKVISFSPQLPAAAPASSKGAMPADPSVPQYDVLLVPSEPLKLDMNYELEVVSDDRAVVGLADASAAEEARAAASSAAQPVTARIKLSTNSGPLPIRVERSNDPKKPLSFLRIRFSEPIALGTLAGSAVRLAGKSGAAASCVYSPQVGACAQASETELTDQVDVMFEKPIAAAELDRLSLEFDPMLRGRGRSVADAAAERGIALANTSSGARLRAALAQADFAPCSAEGDVVCVRELSPRFTAQP